MKLVVISHKRTGKVVAVVENPNFGNMTKGAVVPAIVIETPPKRRGRKSKNELRSEYRIIRNKFLRWFGKDTVDAAIRAKAAQLSVIRNKAPSPEMWVEAIKQTLLPCDHCDGSGQYKWGPTINGKIAHSEPCFRCKGKGRMNADDCSRTATYHNSLRVG